MFYDMTCECEDHDEHAELDVAIWHWYHSKQQYANVFRHIFIMSVKYIDEMKAAQKFS